MTCSEFQERLPEIIDSGGNEQEQEHLRECDQCAVLVSDLKYIAEQVKLMLPLRDPSPRVWDKIQTSLEKEGLVGQGRFPGLIGSTPTQKRFWSYTWIGAAAAALLVAFIIGTGSDGDDLQPTGQDSAPAAAGQPQSPAERDDATLLSHASWEPSLRSSYEQNLKAVNSYIRDAEQAVRNDPSDDMAREHLVQALAQKQMLYDMAVQRTLQ